MDFWSAARKSFALFVGDVESEDVVYRCRYCNDDHATKEQLFSHVQGKELNFTIV